jgi:GAF domain-containing protein
VTTADIASDPSWKEFRTLAIANGVRSRLAFPIISMTGDVLGVFATYSSSPRKPSDTELQLAQVATRLASISIERERAPRLSESAVVQ